MKRKVSIGFGIFAVLLVALLVIPQFIDLNQWRPQIEEKASAAIGREVHIDGGLSLSVLPYPSVTLHKVRLGNADWAQDPNMVQVEEVSVSVSILPLFTKSIELSQISLVRPQINLEVGKDGKTNWDTFTKTDKLQAKQTANQGEDEAGFTFKKTIPKIHVHKGSLTYKEGETSYHVTDFIVSVKSQSVQGPFEIKGGLKFENNEVEFDSNIDEISKSKPFTINTHITGVGQRIQLKGEIDPNQRQFVGKLASKFNLAKLPIEKLALKKELTVTSDLVISEKMLEAKNLLIKEGQIEINGSLNATFDKKTSYDFSMKDLPGNTSLAISGTAEKPGSVEFNSTDIATLITWVQPDFKQDIPVKAVRLESQFQLLGTKTTLSDIKLDLDGRKMNGSISLALPEISADVAFVDLTTWLNLFKLESPETLGNAKFKGTATLKEEIKFNGKLDFAGGHINADGAFVQKSKEFDVNLDIAYPNLPSLLKAFGTDPGMDLGAANLKLGLSGSPEKISFKDLKGTLGKGNKPATIAGQGSVTLYGKKPVVATEIELGHVVFGTPKSSQAGKGSKSSTKSSFQGWSKEKIDPSFLHAVDVDIKLKAASITYDKLTITDVSLPIQLNSGVLTLSNIKANVYGGPLTGNVIVEGEQEIKALCNFKLTNAGLDQIVAAIMGHKVKGGTLNADLSLNTEGKSQHKLIAGLNGKANLTAENGSLLGIDIQSIVRKIKSVSNPWEIPALFEKDSGSTKFAKLVAQSTVTNGTATITKLDVEAPSFSATGKGNVNLLGYTLNIATELFILALPEAPSVKAAIFGPLDNPKTSYNTDELVKYIFQNVGGETVNKFMEGATGVLKGVLDVLPGIPGLGNRSSGDE